VTEDNRPTDLELIGRDVAAASKTVALAIGDVEDIATDSGHWPQADVAELAMDAVSALQKLSDALDIVFEATDPKENR
jgi:hypothetical protein